MSVPSDVQAAVSNQKHLLAFYDELSATEREELSQQILEVNVEQCRKYFDESADIHKSDNRNFEPIATERHVVFKDLEETERKSLWNLGLRAIANGEVCALVLAGGQASRLGSIDPKGTIPLGINAAPQDSLLGIQAAKIKCLQDLAKASFPSSPCTIQWVVMTSRTTEAATRRHLKTVISEAGLSEEQFIAFSQAEIPAFDMEGNLLLASKSSLVTSPNGNGGIYSALSHHLPELEKRGVKYFHVYCVDNILCKVADPYFIGHAVKTNADCMAKTVLKREGESVGSICLDSGRPRVTEYSELGPELAARRTEDGRPVFGNGSIAIHLFTMKFLKSFCTPDFHLPFHRALKKIAHVNKDGQLVKPEKPNGIKLEQFIFDVFPMSKNFYIWEVEREEEFSPLKNAESAGVDCLSTCRRDLAAQSARWLKAAGAVLQADEIFVRSSASYEGEGLDNYKGEALSGPVIG